MRFVACAVTCFLAPVLCLSVGCRNRDGNGNGNGNDNDNGTVPAELTAEQQAAVDAVVKELQVTAKAVGGVVESFPGIDAEINGTFGQCPVVTAQFENGTTNVIVDFGIPGCTSEYYDNDTVSGSASLALARVARTIEVVFNNLTVDGAATTGTANFALTRDGNDRALIGSINSTTSGVGSAVGDLTVSINLVSLTIAVDNADLVLTDENADSYAVDATGLLIDPLGNRNFISESGTVSFEIPNENPGPETLTVLIEFDANSPNDGTVDVTVGSAEPVEYHLPTL